MPVYAVEDLIDLKCCIAGQTYRAGVVVHNRGKVALKCRLRVRPELEEFLEFLPKLGFCQAQKSFTFNLKLVPKTGMVNVPALQKFFVDRDLFEVPLQISVTDQVNYPHLAQEEERQLLNYFSSTLIICPCFLNRHFQ